VVQATSKAAANAAALLVIARGRRITASCPCERLAQARGAAAPRLLERRHRALEEVVP
jgi:hypothetical protein